MLDLLNNIISFIKNLTNTACDEFNNPDYILPSHDSILHDYILERFRYTEFTAK